MSTPTQALEVTCPECGAPSVQGLTCWEMLGMLIAWEYDDPELQAEHFLTVACYNLQYPAQFTEATLAGLQTVFIERLDYGLGIAEIRRRVGKAAAGATRVLKPEAERRPVLRQWTILRSCSASGGTFQAARSASLVLGSTSQSRCRKPS